MNVSQELGSKLVKPQISPGVHTKHYFQKRKPEKSEP